MTYEVEFENDPTALYRFYDADDTLLYVGIAFDPRKRTWQHAREDTWWGDVVRRTLVWYGTRAEASEAENAAMDTENPRHNQRRSNPAVASPRGPRSRRFTRTPPVRVDTHQPVARMSWGGSGRLYFLCCSEGPQGRHSGGLRIL